MIDLKERYVVAGDGRPTAVMLDVRAYRRLLRHVEELEDALALDEAVRTAGSFRPYAEIRAELKKEGRL
jgi:PHD/YefM family antitoxin component YafN of YafNO toxin-antitoxin module